MFLILNRIDTRVRKFEVITLIAKIVSPIPEIYSELMKDLK